VTIGQIIGMAAHLEGKGTGVMDMAGLAQKGGAVQVHVRIAEKPETIQAIRVPAGGADLVIGGDLVVTASSKVMAAIRPGETQIVVNTEETMTGDFARSADFSLPFARLKRKIGAEADRTVVFVPATKWAVALFGNSIASNMFLLGHAWQMGAIPLSEAALLEAIRINGEAVPMNQAAFLWGRRAAVDPVRIAALIDAKRPKTDAEQLSQTFDEMVARRVAFLTDYQDASYAALYESRVRAVATLEEQVAPGRTELREAVARYLFKLMAYKDEYEVARLYSGQAFRTQLGQQFGAWDKLEFHLAPPLLGRRDPVTGHLKKQSFGPWMMRAFGWLARGKRLRGGVLDVFGYTAERRTERRLIAEYEAMLDEFAGSLTAEKHATAVALAAIPEKIRGFGHVKEAHLETALAEREALLVQYRAPGTAPLAQAAE
jgi:indolepyruvate ferredoxin oxidoreductase